MSDSTNEVFLATELGEAVTVVLGEVKKLADAMLHIVEDVEVLKRLHYPWCTHCGKQHRDVMGHNRPLEGMCDECKGVKV